MREFATRAAMPGNPTFFRDGMQDYSIDSLKKLQALGTNTVFINLPWGRPWLDVVVLEAMAVSRPGGPLAGADRARRRDGIHPAGSL